MAALDTATALIVVDLQVGTTGNPAIQPVDEVVARGDSLARAFRARGLPVVIATVTATPPGRNDVGSQTMQLPEPLTTPVIDVADTDIVVRRGTWSAFAGTDLQERLADVTQVVIAGVATSFGVESTARAAYDLGYSVLVVTDAIKDMRPAAHGASVANVFPILGETATTAEVLGLL